MKNFLLLLFLVATFIFEKSYSQCPLSFTYTIGNNNVVTFVDSTHLTCYLNFNFGDTSSGERNSYTYGSFIYGRTHFYKNPGTYTVCESSSPPCGCSNPFCRQVVITNTGSNCNASYCYTAYPDSANGLMVVNFTNTSTSDDSITTSYWNFWDGNLIELNDLNFEYYYTFPLSFPPQLTTLYIATANGCQSAFIDSISVGTTCDTILTGISEQTDNKNLKISPNPFSPQLTFTVANSEPATITLYDIFSRQILQQTFTNSTTLNTQPLAAGIYFYELRNDKGVVKKGKVVKE